MLTAAALATSNREVEASKGLLATESLSLLSTSKLSRTAFNSSKFCWVPIDVDVLHFGGKFFALKKNIPMHF